MAARGDLRAINQLAQDQYFGNVNQGVPENREEAIRNYERAANLGDVRARANVAILNFQKARTEEEKEQAVDLLQKSASEGIHAAQNALAWAYENG